MSEVNETPETVETVEVAPVVTRTHLVEDQKGRKFEVKGRLMGKAAANGWQYQTEAQKGSGKAKGTWTLTVRELPVEVTILAEDEVSFGRKIVGRSEGLKFRDLTDEIERIVQADAMARGVNPATIVAEPEAEIVPVGDVEPGDENSAELDAQIDALIDVDVDGDVEPDSDES